MTAANEVGSPVSAGRQRSESRARGASPNSDNALKASGDPDAASVPIFDESIARDSEAAIMHGMRTCPHGVNVGPLDDYGVPAGERVFSTYCAECHHEQTGRYPWDDEAAAYTWPQGYHPRTLGDDNADA